MKRIAALIFCLWFIFFFIQTKSVFAQDICTDHHVDPEQNYPVNHPDINLDVRSHFPIDGKKERLNLNHDTDQGRAPQLTTLIRGNPRPAITSLQQMCDWDWNNNVRRGVATTPPDVEYQLGGDFATLVGFQTNAGQEILVPDSEYDIGGGCEVLVLYATNNSITLKYTAEDDMVAGYGIHLENFQVDPAIIKMYQELTTGSIDRPTLPALGAGQKLGTALAGEIRVAIRDTGSFMDPRWAADWWNDKPISGSPACQLQPMSAKRAGKVLDKSTQVRADWITEIYHKATTKRPNPSAEPETTVDPIGDSGELIVGPEGSLPSMPGLTQMTNSFVNAFKSLLPANRAAKASLPNSTTKTNTTSYVFPLKKDNTIDTDKTIHCDDGAPTEEDDVAKHTIKISGDWSKLVGAFTGVAGMVLPIAQVADPGLYESFRYQMPKLDWKCKLYKFLYSRVTSPQNMSDPNNDIKRTFRAPGLLEQIVEIIDEAVKKLLGIKAKVNVRVGAELPGGGYANQKSQEVNSAFSTAQRVEDFRAKGRVQSLDGILPTEVRLSPGEPSDNQLSFAGQLQTRDSACNTLCAAYPEKRIDEGTSWAGDDKICPKCDPKNYIIPDPPLPRPSDAPPWCMWDGFGCNFGCDVGKPLPDNPDIICTLEMMQGCGPGKDPVCESGRCNPDEIGPRNDYLDHGCTAPYDTSDDGNCGSVCEWQVFCPNEAGGYGTCHYQNAKVCVPIGGQNSCANVCNAVCCLGKGTPNVQCPKK